MPAIVDDSMKKNIRELTSIFDLFRYLMFVRLGHVNDTIVAVDIPEGRLAATMLCADPDFKTHTQTFYSIIKYISDEGRSLKHVEETQGSNRKSNQELFCGFVQQRTLL